MKWLLEARQRLNIASFAVVLAGGVFLAQPRELVAEESPCGETCESCTCNEFGTETCCRWVNGAYQGCEHTPNAEACD